MIDPCADVIGKKLKHIETMITIKCVAVISMVTMTENRYGAWGHIINNGDTGFQVGSPFSDYLDKWVIDE